MLKKLHLTAEEIFNTSVYLVPTINVVESPSGFVSPKAELILNHWCNALIEVRRNYGSDVPPILDSPGGRPYIWLTAMPLQIFSDYIDITKDADIRSRVIKRADTLLFSTQLLKKNTDVHDPYSTTSIPIPSMHPIARHGIDIQHSDNLGWFNYRGRRILESEILPAMRKIFVEGRPEELGFFGTKGAGRPYLATTAAALLLSEPVPVVFLTFCDNQPATSVIRDALLLAVRSRPELHCHTEQLFDYCCAYPDSLRGLIKFTRRLRCKNIRLLFVVLALDAASCLQEVYQMTEGHVLFFTADPNSELREENEASIASYHARKPLYLNGGLDELTVRINQEDLAGWWSQLQTEAAITLSGEDRELIETTTGNVPLLLTAIFKSIKAAGSFRKEDLRIDLGIYEEMETYFWDKLAKESARQASNIRRLLQVAMANTHLDVIPYLCADRDAVRYFEVRGWLYCTLFLVHNPSMLGYAVEYAITNELGRHGLHLPNSQLTIPKSLPLRALPRGGNPEQILDSGIYVPLEFNHRFIDCVAVWFKSQKVYIYSIQISVVAKTSEHSDSEAKFFHEDWKLWRNAVKREGWDINWNFVWLINCPDNATGKLSRPESDQPARTVYTATLKSVNKEIACRLESRA
ncbi:hypothetical protein BDP27DRAFT_1370344 [Rhodocollybia butyracea]|uniref:Uncharacterized protein n=1 Tax=Rhodocollybia butyracea TaxID=206335 RepID=A0A9P5TZR9_9AGAR|nr:hypothetical protein BDP27DRAFT_1370344 [Rhodocollybia butyracea]